MTSVAHVLWKAKQKGCAIMANDAFRKLKSLKAMCHVSTVPPKKAKVTCLVEKFWSLEI
jgi:hypothetical protein